MKDLQVTFNLQELKCYDEGDGLGDAEPYMWTVFFKADGHTLVVDTSVLHLRGNPTIVPSPNSHGNLKNRDVDAGDVVPIPSNIGLFNTVMKPIPFTRPIGSITEVGGLIGCVVVLMEEDNTSNDAVEKGHAALNTNVRKAIMDIMKTLTITHPAPTDAEVNAVAAKVVEAVKKAISDAVSGWDWFWAGGDMDDLIGSHIFRCTHKQLEDSKGLSIPMNVRWKNEGDWEVRGFIKAKAI